MKKDSGQNDAAKVQRDTLRGLQVGPFQGYEIPALQRLGDILGISVSAFEIDTAISTPTLSGVEILCQQLPEDCGGPDANMVLGLGCGPCGKPECRSCSPSKCRDAIETAVKAAGRLGLRYRITVNVPSGIQEHKYNEWLKDVHEKLRVDAKIGAHRLVSYVFMLGIDTNGLPCLNLLTNADYRLKADEKKPWDCGNAERLGKTYRFLRGLGCVDFCELKGPEVRDELTLMTINMLKLLISGYKPLWSLSSSYDVGITKPKGKVVERMALSK